MFGNDNKFWFWLRVTLHYHVITLRSQCRIRQELGTEF